MRTRFVSLGVKWSQVQILSARRSSEAALGLEAVRFRRLTQTIDPNQLRDDAETRLLALGQLSDGRRCRYRADSEWVKARGIVDRATGIHCARASRQWLYDAAKEALGRTDQLENGHILVMGLATRAAGLHDGAVHALETNNPVVVYTLLRSYAENAAAVLYATEHPNQLRRVLGLGDAHPVKVGTITNYAEQGSKRFGAFQNIYRQLSGFAHPMSKSIFASTTPSEAGVRWRLRPGVQVRRRFPRGLRLGC